MIDHVRGLLWIVDCIDDIESDLSVFHRVDSLDDIEVNRFLRLTPRLAHYEGAVRHEALYAAQQPEAAPAKSMDELILDPVWGSLGSFSKS